MTDLNGTLTRLCKAVEGILEILRSHGNVSAKTSRSRKLIEYSANFEEWWQHYPRKMSKPAASRAYEAAIVRGADKEILISLADSYRDAWSDSRLKNGDYRMYPSTWLNQCMYECDPIDFYEHRHDMEEVKQPWE